MVAKLHHVYEEKDPSLVPDPDQHQSERSDPDPYQSERSDPDPCQSERSDPDPGFVKLNCETEFVI